MTETFEARQLVIAWPGIWDALVAWFATHDIDVVGPIPLDEDDLPTYVLQPMPLDCQTNPRAIPAPQSDTWPPAALDSIAFAPPADRQLHSLREALHHLTTADERETTGQDPALTDAIRAARDATETALRLATTTTGDPQ